MASDFRPFPWRSLDSTTREDAAWFRRARAWAESVLACDRVERALGDLMDTPVRVLSHRIDRAPHYAPLHGGVAIDAAPAGAPRGAMRVRIEVEAALAARVVARSLRRDAPAILAGAVTGTAIAGACAAVLAAAARRAHGTSALCIESAAAALAPIEADRDQGTAALSLTVLVGDDAYVARISCGADLIDGPYAPEWNAQRLSALGPMRLSVPVVAGAWREPLGDLASLRRGDVLIPPHMSVGRSIEGAAPRWAGGAWLAPPAAEIGVRVDLVDPAALMLRGEVEPLVPPSPEEVSMAESNDVPALVDAVGDVPVTIRVEIAEATLAAREWASLGRGDVIALGRPIGSRVVLRVGGIALARGDLVDVDGEIGVRIADRLREDPTATP